MDGKQYRTDDEVECFYRGSRWELQCMLRESKRRNTDVRSVHGSKEWIKTTTHLHKFDHCIIVGPWTFQPTFVLCGGAVVYWIEPLTLNQRVPGSIPVRTSALLSFSKALYPHCCSPPRCINGYPVGCEWDYVSYCLSPFYRLTLWKLPRELRLRTISAVLNSIHWPG